MMIPPTTAPGMLVSPPMTAAGKASRPTSPRCGETSWRLASRMPPIAASTAPSANASENTRPALTPDSADASGFSAVARICRPIAV